MESDPSYARNGRFTVGVGAYALRPGTNVMATAPRTPSEAEEEIRRLRAENTRRCEREVIQ